MKSVFRIALAALTTAAAQPVAASAEERWFTTSAGVRVETPPVAELDCAGLRRVLGEIDSSGYREPTAAGVASADVTLLHYEDRVSRRFYIDCVNDPGSMADGRGAFGYGFDVEGARQ